MRFCTITTRVCENIYYADKSIQQGAELLEKNVWIEKNASETQDKCFNCILFDMMFKEHQ